MEKGNEVIIPEDIQEFFNGLEPKKTFKHEYSEKEKKAIIFAYEHNFPREKVAAKLNTSPKTMRNWYEDVYLPSKGKKK